MPRYMIELKHGDEHMACVRALEAVRLHGSHLVTHADWGCQDGVHIGWLIAECPDSQEAARMVPPELRQDARVICLSRFTLEEVAGLVAEIENGP